MTSVTPTSDSDAPARSTAVMTMACSGRRCILAEASSSMVEEEERGSGSGGEGGRGEVISRYYRTGDMRRDG